MRKCIQSKIRASRRENLAVKNISINISGRIAWLTRRTPITTAADMVAVVGEEAPKRKRVVDLECFFNNKPAPAPAVAVVASAGAAIAPAAFGCHDIRSFFKGES
jgi:hypothetical protein